MRVCATCPALLTKSEAQLGNLRCKACRKVRPGRLITTTRRIAFSKQACRDCGARLRVSHVTLGLQRCADCRGVTPDRNTIHRGLKPVASAESWWIDLDRAQLMAEVARRFPNV